MALVAALITKFHAHCATSNEEARGVGVGYLFVKGQLRLHFCRCCGNLARAAAKFTADNS